MPSADFSEAVCFGDIIGRDIMKHVSSEMKGDFLDAVRL